MTDVLELKLDKFIFRIPSDRYYTRKGLWVLPAAEAVRIGVSDYLQQRSGDIAFADVKPQGTTLAVNQFLASIETIKVNLDLFSPVSGTILRTNPAVMDAPEKINQDPSGEGWLCEISPSNWAEDQKSLLDAAAYLAWIREDAEKELNSHG